jgi:predicted dehydrogenase
MGKKVRVLLAGAAFSADLHLDAYMRCADLAEIVAICDKDAQRVEVLSQRYGLSGFSVYDSWERAVDEVDCDLVDICLPNFLHHDVALAAFKKGRNVICEKPLATTVQEGEEMVGAAAWAGKTLFYAEDWLFAPALMKAMDLVDEGGIGTPVFIRARECHCGSHSPFAQTIKLCGGGAMIHLGIHPVGFVLAMKEGRWTELTAVTSGGSQDNIVHKGMEGEDWAVCTMKFEDGTSALLEANYVTAGGMEDVVDIYGTKGCLHLDLTQSSAIRCYSISGLQYTVEKAEITTGWSRPAVDEKFSLGYVNEIRHFLVCCRDGREARPGLCGADGLEALRVVNLIYKSAREGVTVRNTPQQGQSVPPPELQ